MVHLQTHDGTENNYNDLYYYHWCKEHLNVVTGGNGANCNDSNNY